MKKYFSVLFLLLSIGCIAQSSKWFISFSAAPVVGGPAMSIKSQMKAQGFGDQSETTLPIFGDGTTNYPRGSAIALLARGAKSINERKSLYFIAGIAETAHVEGFKNEGWSNGNFGLFAGSYGQSVSVKYTTYQATAGYMYPISSSRSRFGVGPSLYIFSYSTFNQYLKTGKHTSMVPGATFTLKVPFGKERRLFGIDFILDGNLALPVKMKSDTNEGLRHGSVNMCSASAGLAFSFRNNKQSSSTR